MARGAIGRSDHPARHKAKQRPQDDAGPAVSPLLAQLEGFYRREVLAPAKDNRRSRPLQLLPSAMKSVTIPCPATAAARSRPAASSPGQAAAGKLGRQARSIAWP